LGKIKNKTKRQKQKQKQSKNKYTHSDFSGNSKCGKKYEKNNELAFTFN
jgi:hypothetical protein